MSVDKVIYRAALRIARQFDKNVATKVREQRCQAYQVFALRALLLSLVVCTSPHLAPRSLSDLCSGCDAAVVAVGFGCRVAAESDNLV